MINSLTVNPHDVPLSREYINPRLVSHFTLVAAQYACPILSEPIHISRSYSVYITLKHIHPYHVCSTSTTSIIRSRKACGFHLGTLDRLFYPNQRFRSHLGQHRGIMEESTGRGAIRGLPATRGDPEAGLEGVDDR
jgi:hypothetical protein